MNSFNLEIYKTTRQYIKLFDVVQIQKTDHILFHKLYGYKNFKNIRELVEFSSKIR